MCSLLSGIKGFPREIPRFNGLKLPACPSRTLWCCWELGWLPWRCLESSAHGDSHDLSTRAGGCGLPQRIVAPHPASNPAENPPDVSLHRVDLERGADSRAFSYGGRRCHQSGEASVSPVLTY